MPVYEATTGINAADMVKVIGRDERGWIVLDVKPNNGKPTIYEIEICGRHLKLVSQEAGVMRVYVNPTRGGYDEWQTPAGTGKRLLVGSPLEEEALVEELTEIAGETGGS